MGGFNLPPGCTTADIERAMGSDAVCDVCGQWADSCICPECPVCSEAGRIACYAVVESEDKVGHHSLLMTREQFVSRANRRIDDLQNQINNIGETIEWVSGLPEGEVLSGILGVEVLEMRSGAKK